MVTMKRTIEDGRMATVFRVSGCNDTSKPIAVENTCQYPAFGRGICTGDTYLVSYRQSGDKDLYREDSISRCPVPHPT